MEPNRIMQIGEGRDLIDLMSMIKDRSEIRAKNSC